MAHANSAELERYGLTVGLKNYAAAYCTGLLVARRLLKKVGLDSVYQGNLTFEGDDEEEEEFEYTPEVVSTEHNKRTYFVEELNENRNPFHAIFDCGLITTTTGSRIFGALKGATDGGLDIPHNHKRFPGYDRETKEYDAELHKERIFGEHVAEYMRYLIEEDGAKYKTQFAEYIKAEVDADSLEDLYTEVHEKIREDPSPAEKKVWNGDREQFKRKAKKPLEQRKADVEAKRAAIIEAEEDEE
jgi:large subunit ribosomal protein L5e